MQYPQVIRWLNNFVPEMRNNDPAQVLLSKAAAWRDHDTEEEMPVSVLEKAAQIYNQGVVLEDMRDGNRGATRNLIDIDRLVTDYVQMPKAASQTLRPRPVELSCKLPNLNFRITATDDMRKVAFEAPAAAPAPVIEARAPDVEAYETVAEEMHATLRAKAAAWKHDLLTSGDLDTVAGVVNFPGFAGIEAEASAREPWMAKAAAWLESHWARGPVVLKVARAAGPLTKLASTTPSPHCARLTDLGNALAEAVAASDLCEEARKEAGKLVYEGHRPKKFQDHKAPKPSGEPAPEAGGVGQGSGGKPKEEPKPSGEPAPDAGGSGPSKMPSFASSGNIGAGPSPEAPATNGKPTNGAPARKSLIGQVLDIGRGIKDNVVTRTLEELAPAQNKRQQLIDQSVQGVQDLNGLQRLMRDDAVISKADPQLVVDIFSTIRRGSPDIASDPMLLRFQLREALQYGGMPGESYAQLNKIREMSNANADDVRKRDQATYAGAASKGKAPSKPTRDA
jgi:hypothetical protein